MLLGLGVALAASPALAVGEEITDVRVLGNQRTEESTVRSVAGISIGDTLEMDTLDMVRERLNTTGLFADVNVWWEQHKTGVRVNIAVKDKFPWAPVPTGSWSANNKSFGLLFVHGNLFGRGKQLLIGGQIATVDSGAALAYRDPSLFGSWIYWQLQGNVQRQNIPEYSPGRPGRGPGPFRVDAAHLLRHRARDGHRLVPPGEDAGRVAPGTVQPQQSRTMPTDPTRRPLPLDAGPRARQVGIGKASHVASTSARASSRS